MSKCIICNTSQNIVMSGTDALMLEAIKLVERICYPCARAEQITKQASKAKLTKWYEGTLK